MMPGGSMQFDQNCGPFARKVNLMIDSPVKPIILSSQSSAYFKFYHDREKIPSDGRFTFPRTLTIVKSSAAPNSMTLRAGNMLFAAFGLSLLIVATEGRGFGGIPGRYCSTRAVPCCLTRDDDCTAPILTNHLCYCDMFCNRGENGNDCCPDFEATCKRQPADVTQDCTHENVRYSNGDRIQKNCETCTCVGNRWQCNGEACLIQEDLLKKVSNGRYSWRPTNYTKFWGRSLEDGIRYRLGTLFPDQSVQNMNEILITPLSVLPDAFDARDKWPGYVHEVRDQGDCGSSWAVSTTLTSADRLAIMSNGEINVQLSPQHLLSCNQHRQRGCDGGYLDRAWWYIRKLGVVSEECYPYTSGQTKNPGTCFVSKAALRAEDPKCVNPEAPSAQIYKMTPPYRISSWEDDIQTEIITNGPVQATFRVHEDFFMYSGGVYQHTELADEKGHQYAASGYHSVRIIGWGVDESTGVPIRYWLCANSWGPDWGERGLFRILRGENHCEIESFVIGAWGKAPKKRRRFKVRKLRRRMMRRKLF
uniref:SMB domain-containing protein n=1 Tax=Panagrellus redivivus TaxID=6233 RepID=A0A7E4VXS9_PANRE